MLILIILSFYDRVRVYLIPCQVLRPKSTRKNSISLATEVIPPWLIDEIILRARSEKARRLAVEDLCIVLR